MTHPLFTKRTHTIGDLYDAVLSIHDGSEARQFYEEYVVWMQKHGSDAKYRTPEGAAYVVRSNIGWLFGEGMPQRDVIMWAEACGAEHPIFGARMPTFEEAFAAGLEHARRLKDGRSD